MTPHWDYLVLTASNTRQAQSYSAQLHERRTRGMLPGIRNLMVVSDPYNRRVGSGGSTLHCLAQTLNRELPSSAASWTAIEQALKTLKILIVHAGGDSRRLPAYGPCGKVFTPVPGVPTDLWPCALLDRLLPPLEALGREGPDGQVVIASGDALLLFDPRAANVSAPGVTMLASGADPEEAGRHGVFCTGEGGSLTRFLQKADPAKQARNGAIQPDGRSLLDIGVMSLDTDAALSLLRGFCVAPGSKDLIEIAAPWSERISAYGLDLYREICCALGSEASFTTYLQDAQEAGSGWPAETLSELYQLIHRLPASVRKLDACKFLHFGASRELLSSGLELMEMDCGRKPDHEIILTNCRFGAGGAILGAAAWLEACRIENRVSLGGDNVVVGVDVAAPLSLARGACLDLLRGTPASEQPVWFVRCYGVDDTFKTPPGKEALFCNRPVADWLQSVHADDASIWDPELPESQRILWTARLFPTERRHEDYARWLWMFAPDRATDSQKEAWRRTRRYSCEEIALAADHKDFFRRRADLFREQRQPG
ncbi:MAG TPA: L-fucokinase [Chthonomonadales bacterium]|nr:L-fucokinase [Chthonomonadales bacterium]